MPPDPFARVPRGAGQRGAQVIEGLSYSTQDLSNSFESKVESIAEGMDRRISESLSEGMDQRLSELKAQRTAAERVPIGAPQPPPARRRDARSRALPHAEGGIGWQWWVLFFMILGLFAYGHNRYNKIMKSHFL